MSFDQASPCQNILEGRSKYLDSLYNSCFEKVSKMVMTNSGTEDDAYDIFQEALIVLYQNCQKENFKLTCEPCTFLFSVSYKRWLSELERRRKVIKKKLDLDLGDGNISYKDDPHMQRERLVAKYFSLLEGKCRQILQLSAVEGLPGKVVAAQLKFKSYEYYRLAKKRCIDTFFNTLENDGNWNDLKS